MDPALIEVIPNGMDLSALVPSHAPRYEEPTVVYLGRLKRYKGVDLILRAVARLRAQGLPVRLLVGGRGDHEPALRALVGQLRIGEAVTFLGFVSEDRKKEMFQRSWVHALTSPKEGWGIAVLEAAACGTCTVASDSPGLRDSVVDGVTGLMVSHGDVGALAGALGRVLGDPDLRDRLGRQARGFAERFSWDASADAMEGFLTRVVRNSRRD